jgi:TPR repeat protein
MVRWVFPIFLMACAPSTQQLLEQRKLKSACEAAESERDFELFRKRALAGLRIHLELQALTPAQTQTLMGASFRKGSGQVLLRYRMSEVTSPYADWRGELRQHLRLRIRIRDGKRGWVPLTGKELFARLEPPPKRRSVKIASKGTHPLWVRRSPIAKYIRRFIGGTINMTFRLLTAGIVRFEGGRIVTPWSRWPRPRPRPRSVRSTQKLVELDVLDARSRATTLLASLAEGSLGDGRVWRGLLLAPPTRSPSERSPSERSPSTGIIAVRLTLAFAGPIRGKCKTRTAGWLDIPLRPGVPLAQQLDALANKGPLVLRTDGDGQRLTLTHRAPTMHPPAAPSAPTATTRARTQARTHAGSHHRRACMALSKTACLRWADTFDPTRGARRKLATLRKALALGCKLHSATSCLRLGRLCESRKDLKCDKPAGTLYAKACLRGALTGCDHWSRLHAERNQLRVYDGDVTYSEAVYLSQQACTRGRGDACAVMGVLLEQERYYPMAFGGYQRACELKHGFGCYRLGYLLRRTNLTPYKAVVGKRAYLRRACSFKYAPACHSVAQTDWRAALCAANGKQECYALAMAQLRPTDPKSADPKRMKIARTLLAKSCKLGHGQACLELGKLWRAGISVKRSAARARWLFRAGCRTGNCPQACRALMAWPVHGYRWLWSVKTGDWNKNVVLLPSGGVLSSSAFHLRLHNQRTGKVTRKIQIRNYAKAVPGGLGALGKHRALLVAGKGLYLVDLKGGRMRKRVTMGHQIHIAAVRAGRVAVGLDTKQVQVYDTRRFGRRDQFTVPAKPTGLALSKGGRWLAVGLESGEIVLRDLSRKRSRKLPQKASSAVQALMFSPDGKQLFWGAGGFKALRSNLQTGKTLRSHRAGSWLTQVRFLTPSLVIATGSDGLLLYHRWENPSVLTTTATGSVSTGVGVGVSADGSRFCAGDRDGRISCFERVNRRP